jgi:uncharacterized Fe-S cluster protein YjdI
MDNIICIIDISSRQFDKVYTFYKDGKVKLNSDHSHFKINQENWLDPNLISDLTKKKLLEMCPPEFIERIRHILNSRE